MLIDDFYYSLADKKTNEKVSELVESLLNDPSCPKREKSVLEFVLQCASKGAYPSAEYFNEQGYELISPTKSAAELAIKAQKIIEGWKYEDLRATVIAATNSTESYNDLCAKLGQIVDVAENDEDDLNLDDYQVGVNFKVAKKPEGFLFNIQELDTITSGVQPGQVASICAFTSEGKSTLAVSAAYHNIKKNKSGVLVSMEVPPELANKQFYSRWLYEEKHLEISAKAMDDGSLDEAQAKLVEQYQEEYNEFIKGKLLIVDEAVLSRRVVSDFKALRSRFKSFERVVDSLDFIIYDHINQVDLIFKDQGNTFVRVLTSAGKTYVNAKGLHPASIMCVQVNREGRKRAQKREGKYDLQAISDLNEVERSSYMCVFMYTSDDMKLLQETKICMLKHRMGGLLTEPVSVTFNPGVFVVGETVDTVAYTGNLDFLNDGGAKFDADDFDDF